MVQRDPTFSPPVSFSKISEIESALGESIRGKGEVLRLPLACLLARVDGKSPLEYLDVEERDRQRAAVLKLMAARPAGLST